MPGKTVSAAGKPAGVLRSPSKARRQSEEGFRIVAIGASAGGLEAVSLLLENLKTTTGMAFFYVQHLSPDHPSTLAFILSKSTKMRVLEVSNMLKLAPNTVYVCTPNREM